MAGIDRRDRRRAAAARAAMEAIAARSPEPGDASTPLHDERLDTVVQLLLGSGARRVLDLGCGTGALLLRLAAVQRFTRIVGVDSSAAALRQAEHDLARAGHLDPDRISLLHGSFAAADLPLHGYDAAALVETIEHVPPARLSLVERAVFAVWRPEFVVITTPNREYNPRFGLTEGERRRPDHHFEWDRAKFGSWADGVARRNGYQLECAAIGPPDPLLGSPTQVGVFRRTSDQEV